jgi:cysteine desulfurase / selenocysteine lyase
MNLFNPVLFRQQFPLIATADQSSTAQPSLIYFDNAATSQKPSCVIETENNFYQQQNANVHRGSHQLSAQATQQFEQARTRVKSFINARSIKEIIWTKGATEAINLVATSWALKNLTAGDEIVLSYAEHHANIVPWQMVAEQTGAIINVLTLTKAGRIDTNQLNTNITNKTRLVCISHISNVIGKINPLEKIIARAKQVGALTLIDGAQALAHANIDVQQLDCDFYLFSAHKAYAPMGLGVLYGREELLDDMVPYQTGGEMIKKVSFAKTTFNELPFKFEAGTPNVAAAIAFAQALIFMQNHAQGLAVYEQELTRYTFEQLSALNAVNFIVEQCPDIPLFAFSITGLHNHDVATSLDSYGIAVRSGHHCAMPLMEHLAINGCVRVSLAAYNNIAEVDYFIQCLKAIISHQQTSLNKPRQARAQVNVHAEVSASENVENLTSAQIIELFSANKSWDARHREIMLLGKKLQRLSTEQRNEQTLIEGCESLAWLTYQQNRQGDFIFTADSDAKIIRGLLVIVLAAFNGKNSEQIIAFKIDDYFAQLGLLQHLSPSRGNGIKAIVEKIILIAKSH